MAKRCTKCGTFLTDEDRFCPNCGENAPQPMTSEPRPAQTNYANAAPPPYPPRPAAQGGAGLPPPPVYPSAPPRPAPFEEEMTVGKWVLTLIATNFFGLVSWILLFIWAFGSAQPVTRARYCKAMLIVKAIGTVIGIFFVVFYLAEFLPAILYYADYGEFPYADAAALLGIAA